MLPSVGARPNKLLSLEPPHRAARRMNKLCSRNTGLATAAGRSAHTVVFGLVVFSPFGILVRSVLSPSLRPSFSPSSTGIPRAAIHVRAFPFLAAGDTDAPSCLLPSSLSFSRAWFFPANRAITNLPPSHSFPVSSSLQSTIPVFVRPHFSCGLYCARACELLLAVCSQPSRSAHGIRHSLPRSSVDSQCRRPNKYQINETAARNLDVLITGV